MNHIAEAIGEMLEAMIPSKAEVITCLTGALVVAISVMAFAIYGILHLIGVL